MNRIYKEIAYGLIKSGGGNGPMKPGNLNFQGAKSGGKRKMRIRYTHIESRCAVFLCLDA